MSAPLTSPLGGDDLAKALRDAHGRGYEAGLQAAEIEPHLRGFQARFAARDAWIAQYMARLPAAETIAAASEQRVGEDAGRSNVLPSWVADIQPTLSRSGNDITLSYSNPNDAAYSFAEMERFFGASAFASAPSPEAGAGGDLGELVKRARLAAISEHTLYGNDAGSLYDDLADAIVDLLSSRSGKLVASTGSEEETKGAIDSGVLWSAWPETDADSDPSDPGVTYCTEWFIGRWPIGADEPECRILVGSGQSAEITANRIAGKLTSILNTDRLRLKPCQWEEEHLCSYPKCNCASDREPALGTEAEGQDADGSLVYEGPADLSATPEAPPNSSPDQTPVDPQMTVEEVPPENAEIQALRAVCFIQARELKRLDPTGTTPWDLDEAMDRLRSVLQPEAALRTLQADGEVR